LPSLALGIAARSPAVDDLGVDAASSFAAKDPRGAPRLLAHCSAVGRLIEFERGSAWTRLERELGRDLAQLLLVGLLAGGWGRSASLI
jgi:hypothetical protein